jgi:Cof subfamily protein (haloacid dehalogenase superfamily)
MLRLVISDIDGTLLDDEGNLPDLNRRALAECKEAGIRTCLATGRRWTTCARLLDRLELRGLIDFCILNNGMILHDVAAESVLWKRDFPFDRIMEAVARLNALSLDPVVLGHNPDGRTRDVFHRPDAAGGGHSLMNADFIDKNPDHLVRMSDWSELRGRHVVELILIGPEKALRAAAEKLGDLDLETAIIRNSFYREYMLEITPQGVSKLSGARMLIDHLSLREDDVLAVGDSENDYLMIKHLPHSAAVANADPRLKAAAREVTGTNAEGGFGQAVLRRLRGKV